MPDDFTSQCEMSRHERVNLPSHPKASPFSILFCLAPDDLITDHNISKQTQSM